MNKKKIILKNNRPLNIGLIFASLGIVLIIIFSLNPAFNDWSWKISPRLAADFGNLLSGLIGPIFSIVGFLLIIQSIIDQRKINNIQNIENKLFQLIEYYQKNVYSMKYTSSSFEEEKIIEGRDIFIQLKKQVIELFKLIKSEFPKLDEKNQINITYIIFFYGVSLNTLETTKKVLSSVIEESKINYLIKKIRKIKTKYNNKIVFYGGHQSKLGNYFRQIYHIIRYIDEQDIITEYEKYEYVKLFRSQLSNYEQALLFINSLSVIGKPWIDNNWINKYHLIKNIPPEFIKPINFKKYFPAVEYEYDEYIV